LIGHRRCHNPDEQPADEGPTRPSIDATNFRSDVNANGSINAGDIALAKQYTGTSLPPD
jgi:hypothetical protein